MPGSPRFSRKKKSASEEPEDYFSHKVAKNSIPEDDEVSHLSTPALPTFQSLGGLALPTNEEPMDAESSDPVTSKRRIRANSVERDANAFLENHIKYAEDLVNIDEDSEDGESNEAIKSDKANIEPENDQKEQKRKVEFYDSDSSSTKTHEKIQDKDPAAEPDEAESTNSDLNETGFMSRVLNFKHSNTFSLVPGMSNFRKHKKNDEEQQQKEFEMDCLGETSTKSMDSDEERERINEEVSEILKSHTTKLGRFFKKTPKNSTASPSISKSSSKSSLNDLFYASFDPSRAAAIDHDERDEEMQDRLESDEYVPPPAKVQDGVLASIMKMYNLPSTNASSLTVADDPEQHLSPTGTSHKRNASGGSLFSEMPEFKSTKKPHKSDMNLNILETSATNKKKMMRKKLEAKITVHLANLLQKKNFILKMCTAFMLFGAPTHRLEEYMVMTSRVLEIDGQFMYFPGCMVVAFNDPTTKTTEMQLLRTKEGVSLSKLHEAHKIYKAVIHDLMGVEDASKKLDGLMESKPLYPPWLCVLIYAFGSSMVCPFAFNGNWVDMPVCFAIGLCVGTLQFYISPRSSMYSNVFEVAASIVVSFLARALGLIDNGKLFCFSALVQGSLALILPGFIILTGSLELQSRNIVTGSVRMFYAIIYSLFLSFGITIGAALYGWIDKSAISTTTCYKASLSPYYRFLFVPMFSLALSLLNQANWRQLPIMTAISCAGYVISYFSSLHFTNSSEFTSALAAMIIGICGNLYSRIYKGLAISAMLPAIFVQVPSGIAGQGSLLAGVQSANQIVSKVNGTETTTAAAPTSDNSLSFGFSMIQVAIGISVGLFTASILVYPFGKKKTALFTL